MSEVTSNTLTDIYKVGAVLENLYLVGCGIRRLPDNLFLYLPRVQRLDFKYDIVTYRAHIAKKYYSKLTHVKA